MVKLHLKFKEKTLHSIDTYILCVVLKLRLELPRLRLRLLIIVQIRRVVLLNRT